MIVASHQPNFMPHMGFFYKMYMCDIFTFSNGVRFSSSGFHNYNYIMTDGGRRKITVPVSDKGGRISQVRLCDWEYNRKKIIKRLANDYANAPYFDSLFPLFEAELSNDYVYMEELNIRLIYLMRRLLGIRCYTYKEEDIFVSGDTPTAQIRDICRKLDCHTYLSGTGAMEYLDVDYLERSGIGVEWSNYKPVQDNLSAFDYLMNHGTRIPNEWKTQKEVLQNARGRV